MTNSDKTGYVYDPIFLKHDQAIHPENANRLIAIMDELTVSGLLDEMIKVSSRKADAEELEMVHTKSYVKTAKDIGTMGGYFDGDTYATPHSFDAAATAAGSIIDLGLEVANCNLKNGFAFVRPPGHHSLPNHAMGFCIFSNAALAAKAVLNESHLKKIAIIDFDVHHGNGTQEIFYYDSNVLFVSSHQYPQYPGSGSLTETGGGEGSGYTVNFPLPAFCGDESIKIIYEEILNPILHRFEPEMIIVSAGYDCHWNDPLANLGLSLTGLTWISQYLIKLAEKLCDGRIMFTLEGGYNLDVLKSGAANSVRALLGKNDFQDKLGKSLRPEPDITQLIKRIKELHDI